VRGWRRQIFTAAWFVVAATAATSYAAVRVAEDEVFFTLVFPGAKEVYLVGDFNNWNATVEKLERFGDSFEISLYMVEGSYRYKFVVDGKWIVDPDNPGTDPKRGSPLVLVERPAGLMLSTEDTTERKAVPGLKPRFRYVGDLDWNQPEEKRFDDFHIFDLDLLIEREKLRGRALVKTTSATWNNDNGSVDITMDRGFVGTDVGGLSLDGFHNEASVWTSKDPLNVVGNLGVFDYNAGYDRTGVSAEYQLLEPLLIRAMYGDHFGPFVSDQPAFSLPELSGVASGADTTVYAFDSGVGDSDVFGFELLIEASAFQAGIVSRLNRGMRPGIMADLSFADTTAVVFDTRENTDATFYWLELKKLYGVGAVVGYGRGHAEIQQLTQEHTPFDPAGDLQTTQLSYPVDGKLRFEKSNRIYAGLDWKANRVSAGADWDRVTFDFDGTRYQQAKATVDRVTALCEWTPKKWRIEGWCQYTKQDYGNTPEALLIDSPVLNMWLDWRDNFTVANIVGIDTDSYTDLTFAAAWYYWWAGVDAVQADVPADGDSEATGASTEPEWAPPAIQLELGTTTDGFFKEFQYNRVRLTGGYVYRSRYYAMVEGRLSKYDKEEWGGKHTFKSGFVEIGYRYRNWFNAELGWGFDPVVFDRVVNYYQDVGISKFLRRSLVGGVTRGESVEIGERLLEQERKLQNVQTISLEVIIQF
jgi:hypothetical protein